MARGINKVILVGNLGNDPEVRATTSGSRVATISIATSESWTDKTTGQKQEKTEWHRVVFFNRLAEIVEQYLKKGSQVYVEGRLQTRKWQDKDGQDKYTTEVVANECKCLVVVVVQVRAEAFNLLHQWTRLQRVRVQRLRSRQPQLLHPADRILTSMTIYRFKKTP